MSEKPSKVRTKIDFDADGKQHGYLSVPHSRDDSAWGSVQVPITQVKNGNGPTILFTGGNHGDEYEGPISLMKLARALDPDEVRGRVIIVPALNAPAVHAGTRLSPIDGLNMNRAFPGRRDGTVTSMIAHYLTTTLIPLADVVVDLHSGGKTMELVPCAVIHQLPDAAMMARCLPALEVFGAPLGLVLLELDAEGMLDSTVEEMGKVFISSELGGGGSVTTETVAIADTAVHNLLCHFGLLDGAPVMRQDRGLAPTRLMHTPDSDCYVASDEKGIYEVLVDLGKEVRGGDPVGQIHYIEKPAREPTVYYAERDGMVICRHYPGLVQPGDTLAVIATDYAPGAPLPEPHPHIGGAR